MSDVRGELKYTNTHEWVRSEEDGSVTVGVTDHAQELLGDLVFVETPEVGRTVDSDEGCAVVESVKAASDVYAPIAGKVTAVNEALGDTPELINSDPYGDGWLFRLRPEDPAEIDDLLDADGYTAFCEDEAED
jgi:glycine cleavage system H protein